MGRGPVVGRVDVSRELRDWVAIETTAARPCLGGLSWPPCRSVALPTWVEALTHEGGIPGPCSPQHTVAVAVAGCTSAMLHPQCLKQPPLVAVSSACHGAAGPWRHQPTASVRPAQGSSVTPRRATPGSQLSRSAGGISRKIPDVSFVRRSTIRHGRIDATPSYAHDNRHGCGVRSLAVRVFHKDWHCA